MNDRFSVIPFRELFRLTLDQIESRQSFFGIPQEIFFNPGNNPFQAERFGTILETPLGVAAGPHTQLAQNIIAAWLCGARYIELKTVQTLDELKVSKPCIDMQDEGYNCEWSQELKIHESFGQYLNAWIIIHILKNKLQHGRINGLGTIFNMSVGYDLKGIMQENVQWFFSRMNDCRLEKAEKIREIQDLYPKASNLEISDRLSDSVTLSTMHGCPPDEIGKIGLYLIEEKKLHTIIKLNPTLLGKQKLNEIIRNSGFDTIVPDPAFEHDLTYPDAVRMIRNLVKSANKTGVKFGLKLTNTLESLNNKSILPTDEKIMYMSGRALHPIAINLAAKLQNDFGGNLDISFSAGVNAFNFPKVLQSGLTPVTVCSDILKPGGYGLLNQYLKNLEAEMKVQRVASISEFIGKSSKGISGHSPGLGYLNKYAGEVLKDKTYQRTELRMPNIKSERNLGFLDCIKAPCTEACPTHQDIPDYLYYTANQGYQNAFQTIMHTNPFPNTTGMICDHLCQAKCTRINYDSPLLIRDIKRFIAENHDEISSTRIPVNHGLKAAIIGAGPSGLSCAYFLALTGFSVDVFEIKDEPGGMISGAIPSFRLTNEAFRKDIERIERLGVDIHYNCRIEKENFGQIKKEFQYIYIAAGAQRSRMPNIEGIQSNGVLDPLQFLSEVKKGRIPEIGKNIGIIGGGNTAMDVARTAWRLTGPGGKVTILYRRTIKEMPADMGEIKAVIEEGIQILELVLPVKINALSDSDHSMTCVRMKPGEKDASGRPKPVMIQGSEFDLGFDCIIPAIGQDLAIDFISEDLLVSSPGIYEIKSRNIFIGGDALRGASTAINAIGDGRKAAQKIIERAKAQLQLEYPATRQNQDIRNLTLKRMIKVHTEKPKETVVPERRNFNLVSFPLTEDEACKEASRCLACDEVCNICVTVCPNLANYSYSVKPVDLEMNKVTFTDGIPKIIPDGNFRVTQPYQILHIGEWCNQCGNCATFCPTSGAPYLDKPHLFITKARFEAEEKGYYFDPAVTELLCKGNGQLFKLKTGKNDLIFCQQGSSLKLNKETLEILEIKINGDTDQIDLRRAAEMKLILEGALDFAGLKQ